MLRVKQYDDKNIKDFECEIDANKFKIRSVTIGSSPRFFRIICSGSVKLEQNNLKVSLSVTLNTFGIVMATFFILAVLINMLSAIREQNFNNTVFLAFFASYTIIQVIFYFDKIKYIKFFEALFKAEILTAT